VTVIEQVLVLLDKTKQKETPLETSNLQTLGATFLGATFFVFFGVYPPNL